MFQKLILVILSLLSLKSYSQPFYDDLTCPPNNYSYSYWDSQLVIRSRIFGTWVGRGPFYTVNPDTLEFTTLFWTDAVLKQFYDPSQGAQITTFWIRFVSPSTPQGFGQGVGIPSGNFTSYIDRFQRPNQACLVANNTAQFEQYYTTINFYSTSLETNIHYNRTTQRISTAELFRYPEYPVPVRKMQTTYQLYDDDTNSLVLWNGYNLCKIPDNNFDPTSTDQWPQVCGVINAPPTASSGQFGSHLKATHHPISLWHIGHGVCQEHLLPPHLHKYATRINATTTSFI